MDIHNITHNILKFSEDRYISRKYDNAQELNLKIVGWKQKYQEFEENCKFFQNEINELFFNNVLQAEILFLLMDQELETEEISTLCMELKSHYDLFRFVDAELANSFNKILETNLKDRIEEILSGLKRENVIIRSRRNAKKYVGHISIDKIKNSIIRELKISKKIAAKRIFGS